MVLIINKLIAVALASLAVASVLWNVYSRVSFTGGESCRFVLSGSHTNYWLLKQEKSRLDSDVAKLEKHKRQLDLQQKSAAKKSETEVHKDLPVKIAKLEEANEELRIVIVKIPRNTFHLSGSAEENRKAAGRLYDETNELKDKLDKLKSRLKKILKSIKAS